MKKLFALTIVIFVSLGLTRATFAGQEQFSGKEMKQAVAPACPEWYADREWDVGVWGTYSFAANPTHFDDAYLDQDHAWGGGIDAKYFWHRYFGFGVEGFGLFGAGPHSFESFGSPRDKDFDSNTLGAGLGTLTIRIPLDRGGCFWSRFAPYAFGGIGAISGGSRSEGRDPDSRENFGVQHDEGTKITGQVGGGLEFRITPHIGLTSDFSVLVIDGPKNNINMVRTGVNFAF